MMRRVSEAVSSIRGRRKALGVSTAVVLAISLTGCAGSSESPTNPSGSESSTCTPKHTFDTVEPGALSVVGVQFLPWYSATTDGAPEGIEGQIATLVAKMECLEIKAQLLDGPGVISAVTTGRADAAIGGWTRTKARVDVVDVTDPIYVDPIAIISKSGSGAFADFKGKSMGDIAGNLEIPPLKELLGDSLKIYQTYDQALTDLGAGRIDAVAMPLSSAAPSLERLGITGFQITKATPDPAVPSTLKPGQVGWPVKLGNTALLTALNEDLAALRSDGTLEKLFKENNMPADLLDTGEPYLV